MLGKIIVKSDLQSLPGGYIQERKEALLRVMLHRFPSERTWLSYQNVSTLFSTL